MTESKTRTKKCAHFWVIESPDGRTSRGVCKYCGAVNDFSNDWHDVLNSLNKRGHRPIEEELAEKEPVLDT
jgi:hypothetical protein